MTTYQSDKQADVCNDSTRTDARADVALDDVRERHQRIAWSGSPDTCSECATVWPCDAIRMAYLLVESRGNTLRMVKRWKDALAQRDAANADAERQADALRERECLCTTTHPRPCKRCDALRQHDERMSG